MAVGQVIGRVSVKVMPDTKEFRRDAERQLSKVEKSIRVMIPTRLDMTGAKLDMLKAVRALNQENRNKDSRKIAFFARMDNSGMDAEISKAVRTLTNKAKNQKVKFNADVAAALVEARIDKSQLRDVKKQLQDWRDDVSPLSVMVHPKLVPGGTTWVNKRLDYLSRPRAVPIAPFLEPGAATKVATALAALSGARVLGNMFKDIGDQLMRLDKSVPIIGTVAYAIQGLGAFALAGASNLFALSSSLAQIGPAALALPGIFGGIAIGLGATFAVLKDFNKVLPEVGDKFSALQDTMSSNFWTVAEAPIRNLIDNLFPQLSAGLNKTSTELGGFFAALSKSLEGQFDGALAGMFNDLSESIAIASQHTDAFATIIRVLGEVGAGYLPALAGWIGDLSERFSNFLSTAQTDGSLTGWIDRGIFQLQELGRATAGLGGVFYGLAVASEAAGGSTLTMLADSLDHMNKVVNGPAFQGALTGTLMAANSAMNSIASQAGPAFENFMLRMSTTAQTTMTIAGAALGGVFAALLDALASPAVQTGFMQMIAGISVGLSGLTPAIAPVGEVLGTLMRTVGALAQNIGPVLGAALTVLAGPIGVIGQALIPVINMLGPILTQAITALAPLFTNVAAKFAEIAVAAQPLIARIGELINWLVPVLVPALNLVTNILGGALIGVINGAIQVFDGIKKAVQGFVQVFQGIVMIFQGDIKGGFAKVWSGIKAIFTGAFTALIGAFKVWLNIGILNIARVGIVKLLSFWKGGWSSIKGAASSVWEAIKSVVKKGIDFVKGFVDGGVRSISLLWSATWLGIKTQVTNIWTAIKSTVTQKVNSVKQVVGDTMTAVKRGWMTAWEGVKSVLKTAWTSISTTVTNGVTKVIEKVKSLPQKAKDALSNVKDTLVQAGKSLIDGFISGIGSKMKEVQDAVQGLIDKAKSILPGKNGRMAGKGGKGKGGLTPAQQAFANAGANLVTAMAGGIGQNFGQITNIVEDLMEKVPETASQAFKDGLKSQRDQMLGHLQHWERLTDKIDGFKERLREYAQSVREAIVATGDVTKFKPEDLEDGTKVATTFQDIKTGMMDAIKTASDFRAQLRLLEGFGLNDIAMQQLIAAGPEAGLEAAKALAAGGAAGIQEINDLQAALDNLGSTTGKIAANHLTEAGENIAKGLIVGLENERANLEVTMSGLAAAMVTSIKKELGIQSPSRVMKAMAAYAVAGLALGLQKDAPVVSAATALAGGMADAGVSMIDGLIDGMESRYGKVRNSLEGMAGDLAVTTPQVNDNTASLTSAVSGALSPDGTAVQVEQKILNYHAAPGNSLDSEEDLFAAASRGRMVGW